MERIEDEVVIQLMLSEPRIARLTERVIAAALEGFELTSVRPMWWIARAIQGALYCTLKNVEDGPDRQSNTDTRAELEGLTSRAESLWREIAERSSAADSAIFYAAFRRWDGEGRMDVGVVTNGEPTEYGAFVSDLSYLERLARFMRVAANGLEKQGGPWRLAERREQRIERAHWLSPIFETAYGQEATVNDWPNAKSLGPWADFYARIIEATFDKHETVNPRDVLKEARRRHLSDKVEFAPGIIPE